MRGCWRLSEPENKLVPITTRSRLRAAAKELPMESARGDRLGGALSKYKLLGTSGLRVSPLCFGCMHLADPSMSDKATARRLLERFMDCGGNFFDTSPLDERSTSEAWLGEFLSTHRSKCVIATKFGGCTDPKDPNSAASTARI